MRISMRNKTKPQTFKMPKWMECTWRRVNCGRDACRICGQLNRDRKRHIERGEDPDNPKSAFEDISNHFKETLEMIRQDAAKWNIDIANLEDIKESPDPEAFPLHEEVSGWSKRVLDFSHRKRELGAYWTKTEFFEDVVWYANTLQAKVYRQLCNRWHLNEGDGYGDFDFAYTEYVLGECFKILRSALALAEPFEPNMGEFYRELIGIEKSVAEI